MKAYTGAALYASLLSGAAAFSAASTSNLVLYWGQNSAGSQGSLASYCADSTVDIINLSFLTAYGVGAYTLNFANACEGTTIAGSTLLQCDKIAADIKTCQAAGKKIFLSMGGAAGSYGFSSASQAVQVANDLWNYFGAGSSSIRPFGTSVVDGFDLDIENNAPAYYPEFIAQMRTNYATDTTRPYYISGAPQCVYPDASLKDALVNSYFDFLFIQFYNNYCGAYQYGSSNGAFNYDTWNTWAATVSKNSNVRLYLGLAGATGAANAGTGYISPSLMVQAAQALQKTYPNTFGGVMMWDASQAYANVPSGYSINYAQIAKQALAGTSSSEDVTTAVVAAPAAQTTATTSSSQAVSTTSQVAGNVAPITTTTVAPVAQTTTAPAAAASTGATTTGACGNTYTVVSGDYCYALWTKYGLTSQQWYALNPTLNTHTCAIYPGQVLCLGTAGSAAAATTVSTTPESTSTSTSTVTATSTSTVTVKGSAINVASATTTTAAASTAAAAAATCPDVSASCITGAYACNGYGYLQCNFGAWLVRDCPRGTACVQNGQGVYCDVPGTRAVTCNGITLSSQSKRSIVEESEEEEALQVETSMKNHRINGTHFLVTLNAKASGIMPIPADWYFSFESEQDIIESDLGILYRDSSSGWYSVGADPEVASPITRDLTVHLTGTFRNVVEVKRKGL